MPMVGKSGRLMFKKLLFTKTFQIIFKVVLNGKTKKYWKRRVKKRN